MSGKVWALSDPHFAAGGEDRQAKWDPIWVDHTETIKKNVANACGANDILLMPGDISWAKTFEEMAPDRELLSTFPCQVLLSEGNHDRWCKDKAMRNPSNLPENCVWVPPICFRRGNVAVVATRLCDFDGIFPWPGHFQSKDYCGEKLEKREMRKLEEALKKLPQGDPWIRILMVHFPPLAHDASPGRLTEIIDKYNVHYCVYGHAHKQEEPLPATNATVGNTRYIFASADWLQMQPIEICEYQDCKP